MSSAKDRLDALINPNIVRNALFDAILSGLGHGIDLVRNGDSEKLLSLTKAETLLFLDTATGTALDNLGALVGLVREPDEKDWAFRIRIYNAVLFHSYGGSEVCFHDGIGAITQSLPMIRVAHRTENPWGFVLGIDGAHALGLNTMLVALDDLGFYIWVPAGLDMQRYKDRVAAFLTRFTPAEVYSGVVYKTYRQGDYTKEMFELGTPSAGLDLDTVEDYIILSSEDTEETFTSRIIDLNLDYDSYRWFIDWVAYARYEDIYNSDIVFNMEYQTKPPDGDWSDWQPAVQNAHIGLGQRYVRYRFTVKATTKEHFAFKAFSVKPLTPAEASYFI